MQRVVKYHLTLYNVFHAVHVCYCGFLILENMAETDLG